MKRIVCILSAVLFSVGLVSCGYFIDVSDLGIKDNYDAYYLTVDCHLYIQNKSSFDIVQVCRQSEPPIEIPRDSTVLLCTKSKRSWRGNARDSIAQDKYTFLNPSDVGYDGSAVYYAYDANEKKYRAARHWFPNDNKKTSLYHKENWELSILFDSMYYDRHGLGDSPSFSSTRFTMTYPGNYGWFECAYTYTLTDEALNEE